VEVFEVVLEEGCQVDGKKIEEANFPKEILIGAIVRNGSSSHRIIIRFLKVTII